jgi:hypothetical protein
VRRSTWVALAILVGLLVLSSVALLHAATMPGAKGDNVQYADTDTIDVPVLRQNGVIVGTVAPVIFQVRANQALAAGTVIQHGSFTDRIEIVQISSSGGTITSTANPRILAGVQGQIIVLKGTSATNTYTIPDGNGIQLTTHGSELFNHRARLTLQYSTTTSAWEEITPLTGAPDTVPPTVKVATTANITLSGTQTIDGVALTVTTPRQRVLVKNQTTASQNGVYTVETSTWLRAVDFDESVEARTNATYYVEEGTAHLRNACRLTTTGAITLGTTSLSFECLGSQVVTFDQLASDPATPAADKWVMYCKSTGCFIRDDLGNITGPLGTAGGGSGTGMFTVRVATTANITLSGTQTIDGISVGAGGELVLVKNQSTQTQNGPYVASTGAWSRSTSFDTSAEFVAGFPVYVQDGTTHAGTVWNFSVIGSFTLGTTNATFVRTGAGSFGEMLANKNGNNGYMGLSSTGDAPWDRVDSYAAHPDLTVNSQIDAETQQKRTLGIQNSGAGNLLLNGSGNPRITGCTSGHDGVRLMLVGLSSTKTVTIPNGNSVLLAGAANSVVIGLPPGGASAEFRCNGSTTTWEQVSVSALQQAKDAGRTIIGATDLASAVQICDTANGNCTNIFGSTTQGTNAGAAIDVKRNIPSTKKDLLQYNDIDCETVDTVSGSPVHSYSNLCKPRKAMAFPANAISTDGTNCTTPAEVSLNGGPKQYVFTCANNTSSVFYLSVPMFNTSWDGGAVRATIHAHLATGEVVSLSGAFSAQCHGDGEVVDNTWGTGVTTTVTMNTTNNRYKRQESADITPAGTCAPGDFLWLRYVRTVSEANSANIRILSVTLSYLTSTQNGSQE